jgi:putative endonuclease
MFSVYVLRSKTTGLLYTGSTSDFARRFDQHNSDISRSTKHRGPWELLHREDYPTRREAMRRERELETGKGRDELKRIASAAGHP